MGQYVGGSNLSLRPESKANKVLNDLGLAQLRTCSTPFALPRRLVGRRTARRQTRCPARGLVVVELSVLGTQEAGSARSTRSCAWET